MRSWESRPEVRQARRRLMTRLRREVASERVVRAMERVPRTAFVPPISWHMAYEDTPLAIGHGQTISQPYIVAVMTAALDLQKSDRVLEIGTGSGYQAAVLAELAGRVVTVERVPSLTARARSALEALGYGDRVAVHPAGDALGRPDDGPYDAILVTAGSPKVSGQLLRQMAPGGRLVIPVGSREEQELLRVDRTEHAFSIRRLGPCRFVPLIGSGAWASTPAAPQSVGLL